VNENVTVIEIARMEGAHLIGLVGQFAELIEAADVGPRSADPAVRRLVPDGYADPDAAREFRSLTEGDLLSRRQTDAASVIASLADLADISEDPDDPALVEVVQIRLDADTAGAWLRTLAAIRLVLATRLGIVDEDDHDQDDPRFGIYDWLGYRLDGLVRAIDAD